MLDRCYDRKNANFANYGGRGISVCERWRGSFEAFRADMGPRPSLSHTVDRKDPNGNYEPGNCRWATPKEQGRNMRANRVIVAFGRSQCLTAWAEEFGIAIGTLKSRIDDLGWPIERALTEPTRKTRRAA